VAGRSTAASAIFRAAALAPPAFLCWSPAMAETHGYMISWFANATNTPDMKQNCPEGRNGGQVNLQIRNLVDIGSPMARLLRFPCLLLQKWSLSRVRMARHQPPRAAR